MEVGFDARSIGRWARQRNLLLPLVGLPLATMLLDFSRVGEVSLSEDVHLSRENPFQVFPFRKSLVKVLACFATIFLGGSAGLEGPAKWFGGAVGLQCHRLLSWLARPFRLVRRLKTEAGTMVLGGAVGAISSVFRAPLAAAEHEGVLQTRTLIPSRVFAAAGYLVFAAMVGHEPLLALPRAYSLRWREVWMALPLGIACGLVASFFGGAPAAIRRRLAWTPCAGGASRVASASCF